jgi:hypothetical protein
VPIEKIGTDRYRMDSYTPFYLKVQKDCTKGYFWAFEHFRKTLGYASHPLPESPDLGESFRHGGGASYDGVAELAWRSLNPFAQVANIRLVRDEVGLIDGQRSTLVFGEQAVVV